MWKRKRGNFMEKDEEEPHIGGMGRPMEKEELVMTELHFAWVSFGAQWR